MKMMKAVGSLGTKLNYNKGISNYKETRRHQSAQRVEWGRVLDSDNHNGTDVIRYAAKIVSE